MTPTRSYLSRDVHLFVRAVSQLLHAHAFAIASSTHQMMWAWNRNLILVDADVPILLPRPQSEMHPKPVELLTEVIN